MPSCGIPRRLFAEYVHLNRNVPSEVLVAFENTKDPRRRMYYIASNILQGVDVKQKILAAHRRCASSSTSSSGS